MGLIVSITKHLNLMLVRARGSNSFKIILFNKKKKKKSSLADPRGPLLDPETDQFYEKGGNFSKKAD